MKSLPLFLLICSCLIFKQPKGIRNNSKTLIDNILSNVITPNNISGNITAAILDHLPKFFIVPNIFSNQPSTKLNIFEKDWSKFDQKNFILDYLSVENGELN